MRFLGIDPGTKRIGLAAGDELGLATPRPGVDAGDTGGAVGGVDRRDR